MTRLLAAALVAALPVAAYCLPARAQQSQGQQCGPRDAVIKALAERYGEARRGFGLVGSDLVMEQWSNAATGTWTVTVTTLQGVTCFVAAGTGFEAVAEPLPPPGVPG